MTKSWIGGHSQLARSIISTQARTLMPGRSKSIHLYLGAHDATFSATLTHIEINPQNRWTNKSEARMKTSSGNTSLERWSS